MNNKGYNLKKIEVGYLTSFYLFFHQGSPNSFSLINLPHMHAQVRELFNKIRIFHMR